MACSMCEAHINDAIRKAFQIQKVSSNHKKGQTVIVSENALDEAALKAAIDATGYHSGSVSSEPYVKKGLFGRLKG